MAAENANFGTENTIFGNQQENELYDQKEEASLLVIGQRCQMIDLLKRRGEIKYVGKIPG